PAPISFPQCSFDSHLTARCGSPFDRVTRCFLNLFIWYNAFMKLVVQRVKNASVSVEKKVISSISHGLLVLTGITGARSVGDMNVPGPDSKNEANFLAEKLVKLRIMSDNVGKMNLSVKDVNGSILIVSQFTLYGDTTGGNRPSFINAAR